jgi:N-acetyl-anhydromuramoyl-L-alanine amidase
VGRQAQWAAGVADVLQRCGRMPGARWVRSPNADARPAGMPIELIVIHNISLPPGRFSGDAVERLFTNRRPREAHPFFKEIAGLRVSAHFFLRRSGELVQFVNCADRAWHAGVSNWRGRERCNDFSLGIELEGADTVPYTDKQYQRLTRLLRVLKLAYPSIAGLAGHEEIAPGRKTDPGPHFDWQRVVKESGFAREIRSLTRV